MRAQRQNEDQSELKEGLALAEGRRGHWGVSERPGGRDPTPEERIARVGITPEPYGRAAVPHHSQHAPGRNPKHGAHTRARLGRVGRRRPSRLAAPPYLVD